MQYDFPQIVFQVRTIDDVQLAGQYFPDSKTNILKNLNDRTVYVDYVPYALKNGDIFTLYGTEALTVLNQYRKINNYGWTIDVIYYGVVIPPTPTPTPIPLPEACILILGNNSSYGIFNTDCSPIQPTGTPEPTATPTPTPSPTPISVCLVGNNSVSVSGGKYLFNGNYDFYSVGNGSYLFSNVPASHPIAFLNTGKESKVTYTGQFLQSPPKIAPDGNTYNYYYGDVILNVIDNFGLLSYADYFFGYYGGENNILWYYGCGLPTPTPSPTPTNTPSPTPTATPTATPYIGGKLWMWGNNKFGQLGINSDITMNYPNQTVYDTTNWLKLSSGFGHNIIIKNDGTLWSWGLNIHGEVGNQEIITKSVPVQVGTESSWVQGNAGIFSSAAIKDDSTLWTWGSNEFGQLGNNSLSNESSPVQVYGNDWSYVNSNGSGCFALKKDGTAWVWGRNNDGQLGLNDKNHRSSPTQLGTTSDWSIIASGAWHKAAIKTDGSLWLWGGNFAGQIGDGSTTNISSPVQTTTNGTNWKYVSCGFNHTAAIKTDGSMWLWGNNSIGQLGINSIVNYRNPVREITNSINWSKVECGYYFNVALNTDANIYVWGINNKGQLGIDNYTNLSSPVQYQFGIGQWKDIAAGVDFAVALSDINLTPRPTPTPTPTLAPDACILILSNNGTHGIYDGNCPTIIPTGTPASTPTPTPTPTPTQNACILVLGNNTTTGIMNPNCLTPLPSGTPNPTPTVTNSPTPSPTPTFTESPTPSPSLSPTPTPTESPTPSPSPSNSPSPTPSVTASPTPSPSPSNSPSPSPSVTASPTPTPTRTLTPTPSASSTPTPTPSPTPAGFRYYRWLISASRSTSAAQASEFVFRINGVNQSMGCTTTNPGGSNPAGETPDKLTDGSLSTKWFNGSIPSTIIMDFTNPRFFNGYNWATANDFSSRDPASWTISGSNDNTNWTLLHSVSGFSATSSRQTYNSGWNFEWMTPTPTSSPTPTPTPT